MREGALIHIRSLDSQGSLVDTNGDQRDARRVTKVHIDVVIVVVVFIFIL